MDQRKKNSGKLLVVLLTGIISTTAVVTISSHKEAAAFDTSEMVTSESTAVPFAEKASDGNKNGNITVAPGNSGSDSVIGGNNRDNSEEADLKAVSIAEQREKVAAYAVQAENTPYVWGGNDLSADVDCSGFIQAIYKNFGYDLPRLLKDQFKACGEVSLDSLLPGDLVFYASDDGKTIVHAGFILEMNRLIMLRMPGIMLQFLTLTTVHHMLTAKSSMINLS